MKTLVVYASKHGTTKKCAKVLSEKINGDVQLLDLGDSKRVNLKDYDSSIEKLALEINWDIKG